MAGYDLFDTVFASPAEPSDLRFSGHPPLPWADFRLGSRRLRGGDFLTKWSQRKWAERQIAEAVVRSGRFLPIPFGPNAASSGGDPHSHASYLERLESAGRGDLTRPDLLIVPLAEAARRKGSFRRPVARPNFRFWMRTTGDCADFSTWRSWPWRPRPRRREPNPW